MSLARAAICLAIVLKSRIPYFEVNSISLPVFAKHNLLRTTLYNGISLTEGPGTSKLLNHAWCYRARLTNVVTDSIAAIWGEASRQSPARWMPTPKCGDRLQRIETPDEMEMAHAQKRPSRPHRVCIRHTFFARASRQTGCENKLYQNKEAFF
ncbi:hypothetical protein TRIATDRAFT_91619 [Trichoderma atroviride IMI 206040]|uniref:Uncharacterized protein n=1 Tax=Hypocrea atroviridis (strain ATCC 20476 / IMI 206040) TaxID=452589 RepID=G9PBM5_HYPAI|nr:uncharacterized protein TRIATDRAFT_91619 [Trichoderma atroviride IMI 206040]EHK39769.1 hypothetical protein TRIATDRAFT_91619 [Trichoderma atroviride IMI 206040]